MNDLTYRKAEITDVDHLVELRLLMQIETNKLSRTDVPKDYRDQLKKYFSEAIQNRKYLGVVALSNEKLVATAGVCFYEKPPSLNGGQGLIGYVTNVYTREDFRKRGIATKLMQEISRLAKEYKADRLHLGATEMGAEIYRAVGYTNPQRIQLELKL